MYFRYAFRELIKGKHPDSEGWITRQANHHQLGNELGQFPWRESRPTKTEQHILAETLAQAPIAAIQNAGRFPDWLGYIGLVLFWTSELETQERQITKALIPQFLSVMGASGELSIRERLGEIMTDDSKTLQWTDLGMVESALR